jgi:hypothetical protein
MYACLVVLTLHIVPRAERQEDACESKVYENHNQVDPKPLKVVRIQGTGVIQIRNEIKPDETVPAAFLALFTADKKFVAETRADSQGNFHFDDIPLGQYHLVARARPFCTANIPIQVIKASRKSKLQQQRIVIHYRVSEIDTCSWGAIEKAKN